MIVKKVSIECFFLSFAFWVEIWHWALEDGNVDGIGRRVSMKRLQD